MNENEKLVDKLFFSTPILLIISAIFLISMFVSGWYVFTLKDREVELEKAAVLIERSKEIIDDTKQRQVLLNNLTIEVNNATAEKNIILKEIIIKNEELESANSILARTRTEEQQKLSELDRTKLQIKFNQKQIAEGQIVINNIKAIKPDLEQEFQYLKSKNEALERNIKNKKTEIQTLDEKTARIEERIIQITRGNESIESINTELSLVSNKFNKIFTALENQASVFKKKTERISEETNKLIVASNSAIKTSKELQETNINFSDQINNIRNSKTKMESAVETFESISNSSNIEIKNQISSLKDSNRQISEKAGEITTASEYFGKLNTELKRNNSELEAKISSLQSSSKKLEKVTSDSEKSSDLLTGFNKKLEIETEEIQSTSELYRQSLDDMKNKLKILVEITKEFTSAEEDIKDISKKIESADISLEGMIKTTKNFEEKINVKFIDDLNDSIEAAMKAILTFKKNLEDKT